MNLTSEEFKQAEQGIHPDAEVNKAVIDLLNRTEQIRVVAWQRAEILAQRSKNKALDQRFTIERVPLTKEEDDNKGTVELEHTGDSSGEPGQVLQSSL